MSSNEITVQQLLENAGRALTRARRQSSARDMLPLLVEAQQDLGLAIDETMAEAVRIVGGRAVVEASGGMRLERVREVAQLGVDLISVGALTHSATAVDISLELELLQ